MQKITLSFFLLLFALGQGLYAQGVEGTITIANEQVVGTDYYFDLYLATSPTTTGDIYLADADFRINFDNSLFTAPTFTKKDSTYSLVVPGFGTFNYIVGYCSFVPTSTNTGDILNTQQTYNSKTVASLNSNVLSVELSGPNPTNQMTFDNGIAKIDGTVLTHRLGRFFISGYNGTGNPNLTLDFTSLLSTQVCSYANVAPDFSSSAATMTAASLPVEWLSFTAEKLNDNTVQLNWITGSEINNDRFVIEKRLENGEFKVLNEVKGAGFSEVPSYYDYKDRSPMAEKVYYRIQQIDFDGTADFSDIIEVSFEGLAARYSVYPNPAQEWLTLEVLAERDEAHQYKMLDLRGKTVMSGTLEAGLGQTSISVDALAAGTYVLQVKNAKGQPINLKVTVE